MDKAYIVANKKQELDVLKKLERKGLVWNAGDKPTEWITSEQSALFDDYVIFPYALVEKGHVAWLSMTQIANQEIVYDGRKEEKMYKVTQEFMNELIEWRDINNLDALQGNWQNTFRPADFKFLPDVVSSWRVEDENPIERNNRIIAIIQWLNGEDVFEVEKEPKFYVRVDVDGEEQSVAMWQNSDGESGIAFDVFMRNEPAYTETDADNLVAGLTALNARKVKVEE